MVKKSKLQKASNKLKIKFKNFTKVKKNEYYLVFGSFLVVEQFLKRVDFER
jgi:folylpolyglutamate synthase/dihydropteroate synthase